MDGNHTQYGSSVLLTDVTSEKHTRASEEDGPEPCVSANDDDYLLSKKKQLPKQVAYNKWRKAALAVSYASIFCTFLLGTASFVVAGLAKSSAIFGFAYDAFLDVLTTIVVIWRFLGAAGPVHALERERKACIIIGVCFVVSAVGIFVRAVRSLVVEKHPQQFSGLEAIAGVSLVVLSILAWVKFVVAERISSASLRTDGISSTSGAAMSLGMIMSSLAYDHNKSVWFLDASVAIVIAVFIGAYGARLLWQLLYSSSSQSEEEDDD